MKLKSIVLSLIFCTTIIFPNVIITNNIFLQHNENNALMNQNINRIDSSNITQFMYSGEILGYFVYKSSNISTNQSIKTLEQNIITNKNKIYLWSENTDNVNMQTVDLFETSLMASIVNISIYGMTSWSEFFAEAYSKWTTTPDAMKNKSWEILNNFFTIIYPTLQEKYFGMRSMPKWTNILAFINDYFKTNSVVYYDTALLTKPNNAVDLKYDSKFGFQQIIPNDVSIENNNYTFNAFKTALIKWQNNNQTNNLFNPNIFNQYIINYNNNLSNNLVMMMNDSYTKASTESINQYNNLLDSLRAKYYSSFETLDQTLHQLTNLPQDPQKNVSSIMLKDAIVAMVNYYNWTDDKKTVFENEILNLFNLTNYVTNKNFKYYLRGFIFTSDYPIKNETEGTMGVTETFGSVKFATVIFTGIAFNQNAPNDINADYKMGYWSSPNIFITLNHEMGHVIDGYYGTNLDHRTNIKNDFNNYMNKQKLKDFYSGKIFGYHQIVNEAVKLILIIVFTVIGFPVLIISIIFLSKKFKKKH